MAKGGILLLCCDPIPLQQNLHRIPKRQRVDEHLRRCSPVGAGGVNGVTTKEPEAYMSANWKGIKEQIRTRTYKPQPVLRVEIPNSNILTLAFGKTKKVGRQDLTKARWKVSKGNLKHFARETGTLT